MNLSSINRDDAGQFFKRGFIESTKEPGNPKPKLSFPNSFNETYQTNKLGSFLESQPKLARNLQNNQLRTDDLNQKNLGLQRRFPLDPLEPVYKLPSYQPIEPIEATKEVRDIMKIDDIEGTRYKKDPWFTKTRNVNPYTEIVGSKPRERRIYSDRIASLDVSDINNKKLPIRQQINPLEPVYDWSVDGKIEKYSYNPKPHLMVNPKVEPRLCKFQLNDIQGAKPNASKLNRKDFYNTNYIGDIVGAQSDTLKKGLRTNRHTNPIDPKY